MKKTISIHINQTVFQIDEDAYEKLNGYLDQIKQHYGSGKSGKEILVDIEAGIAEKLDDFVQGKNKSITLAQVDNIIKDMGTVEEIDSEEIETTPGQPEETEEKTSATAKRLYRNPDDVIIAGVCSGLAAYFSVDPVYVRLIFIISIFFNGLGILAYIILWIIMPQAKSSAQKLEMQGQPINLKKIEETVKEKTQALRDSGETAIKKIKPTDSTIKKIAALPVKIFGNIIYVIKKILLALGPIISIIIGISLVLAMVGAAIGLTVALFVAAFNIHSPYIISDIPLEMITQSPFYYPGLMAVYLTAIVPLILIFILGLTLIRRKNTFNGIASGIILGIWVLALAGSLSFAADVAPKINQAVQQDIQATATTTTYDYQDWQKIYLAGNIETNIKQGEEFSISLTGREKDLSRIEFNIQDGQLQINQKNRDDDKICFICFDRTITAEITVPQLDSAVVIRNARLNITGFDSDIYLSLGESGRAGLTAQGQNVECKLSGVSSRLTITGEAKEITCEMDGYSRLYTDNIKAEKITLTQGVLARSELSGEVGTLTAELKRNARLTADKLLAKQIFINTFDQSRAKVNAQNQLNATAHDQSEIIYIDTGATIDARTEEQGEITETVFAAED